MMKIDIDHQALATFCRQWSITELSVFGSVLRDDFRPDSDVDVMVSFAPTATVSLLDLSAMTAELESLFGRPVDLLTRRSIEESSNPYRREAILNSVERLYAA